MKYGGSDLILISSDYIGTGITFFRIQESSFRHFEITLRNLQLNVHLQKE